MTNPRPIVLSAELARSISGVSPGLLRLWVYRGHIQRVKGGYDGVSLLAFLDKKETDCNASC